MEETKPFKISKQIVKIAFDRVKANKGTYGIDDQTISDFEENLKDNLYKIWNRMSSGTYFPKPVKSVAIPKKNGGTRILGIPTVEDRVAQMVAKIYFEPGVEKLFYEDSYGYRPNKSAIDAIGVLRERCWKKDWVVDFDIKGLFDNIRHDYLIEMVKRHTNEQWIILYIERWLKTPFKMQDGTIVERTAGTPQGGVISPVLANLFMHYVFDDFMTKEYIKYLTVANFCTDFKLDTEKGENDEETVVWKEERYNELWENGDIDTLNREIRNMYLIDLYVEDKHSNYNMFNELTNKLGESIKNFNLDETKEVMSQINTLINTEKK